MVQRPDRAAATGHRLNDHTVTNSAVQLPAGASADHVPDLPAGAVAMVAGFLFDDTESVLLVRKARPTWMAGHLNGIGGKVEAGETPAEAMRREFNEEAGLDIPHFEHFLNLSFPGGAVWFFRAFTNRDVLAAATTCTDEPIETWALADLAAGATPTIANLTWILPLAGYQHDTYAPITAVAHNARC